MEKPFCHVEGLSVEVLARLLHNGVPPRWISALLEYFIEYFTLDEKDAEGWNILHYAAYEGHDELVYDLVARFGIDVNTGPPHTWTPIAAAARQGHEDVVETLLELGADLRMADPSGWHPVHYAVSEGYQQIVSLLRGRNGLQREYCE